MTGIGKRVSESDSVNLFNKSEDDLNSREDFDESAKFEDSDEGKPAGGDEDEEGNEKFPEPQLATEVRHKLQYALHNTLRKLLAVWIF